MMGLEFFTALIKITVIFTVIYSAASCLENPFQYPYHIYTIDVSGRRYHSVEDSIDNWLCVQVNREKIKYDKLELDDWKKREADTIHNSLIPQYRQKQFSKTIDDANAASFEIVRYYAKPVWRHGKKKTKYIRKVERKCSCSYEWIEARCRELNSASRFSVPLSGTFAKQERGKVTAELRRYIMRRDNYTCQICGKYMPDGKDIQIDHIVPVSKGGQTVPDNLQVLCSACNQKKSNKYKEGI